MFPSVYKVPVYERLKKICRQRDSQIFPKLPTSYKHQDVAPFMVGTSSVHEHFQQKYEHVKSLLKGIESARMNYARYETYLAFKTTPPDVQMSVTENDPNLSKKGWESEALKVTKQKEAAAYAEQEKLIIELDQILHAEPRRERLEWAQKELKKNRLSFNLNTIEDYFDRSPLMEIVDLYSREFEKLKLFIFEEWGKLNYRIGQEERKWIESIKQQNEQISNDAMMTFCHYRSGDLKGFYDQSN